MKPMAFLATILPISYSIISCSYSLDRNTSQQGICTTLNQIALSSNDPTIQTGGCWIMTQHLFYDDPNYYNNISSYPALSASPPNPISSQFQAEAQTLLNAANAETLAARNNFNWIDTASSIIGTGQGQIEVYLFVENINNQQYFNECFFISGSPNNYSSNNPIADLITYPVEILGTQIQVDSYSIAQYDIDLYNVDPHYSRAGFARTTDTVFQQQNALGCTLYSNAQ